MGLLLRVLRGSRDVTKMDYQKAARSDQIRRARHVGACGPKPVSPKQWSFMKRLAEQGSTFTEGDACCSRHASQWIDGALSLRGDAARARRVRRAYRKK